MIRTIYFSKEEKLQTDLSQIDVAFALHDQEGLVWMDFSASRDDEAEPILRNTFGFHPLAIDDALRETHVPKVDDWGSFLYIVLHAVAFDQDEGDVETLELDIFLGKNFMVTHHDQKIDALERVWQVIQRDQRHLKSGLDHLLYLLVDEIAASFMNVVEELDQSIDGMEEVIFLGRDEGLLAQLFTVRRAVLYLRRILAHQREVLNKLARDDFQVVDVTTRVYFRDVYDHMVRLYDIIEGVRDLVGGTLETYLSVTNNRLNDVMKTLTIITTLFMPISFIAAVFGMNIFMPAKPLDIWGGYPTFAITIILFLLLPTGMYLWMRSRRWM